ncbi:hypothetical protein PEPS_15190 [Persicobacter psychrovividus]|uniref:Uncharacterized protein n=1 Tax=Persicobacter psychrovividus TaxID=387638 RepID=A0ABM7VE58_9BACT|nr:hypothetical protein PEPS_15190 [Persicobacter psychrovividus]
MAHGSMLLPIIFHGLAPEAIGDAPSAHGQVVYTKVETLA